MKSETSTVIEPQFVPYLQKTVTGVLLRSAEAVIQLHQEGATVPFIARYRKEKTGNLDEVQIRQVIDTFETFNEIVKRKAFLVKEIGEQGNLTSEIQTRIEKSWDLGELEEIYRPFKKKKKTKATLAREAGLESLALWLWDVGHGLIPEEPTMEIKAKEFLNLKASIASYDMALKGAGDILIEKIANSLELRDRVQEEFLSRGQLVSKRAKGFKPHSKYETYSEFSSALKPLLDSKNSHRYLAIRRGWQEEELSVDIVAEESLLLSWYEAQATTIPDTNVGSFLKQAAHTALTVYVLPSIKNEMHRLLKEAADSHSIQVFVENVRKVLLASPFGPKVTIGVDPGIRTGCKVALVDKGGNHLSHTVIHIEGEGAFEKAKTLFAEVFKQLQIEAIAVGNGTNGRETETFLRKVLKEIGSSVPVVMVSESGASVYSASDVAREEFPDLDITVRGAISIARRLQDPLSELVKVDPKSIGVGQYQHDVNGSSLKKALHEVVESCVNKVGVDLNTASVQLLSYVSGIGPGLAKNIVEYRKKKLFEDRTELLSVPRFTQKSFEQAAGFLRINGGKVTLDHTGIHPERYEAVRDMAKDVGVQIKDLLGEGAKRLLAIKDKFAPVIGEFTFDDIVKELEKPGRDPRDPFKTFHFREDLMEIKDLQPAMICPGIVTNVTNFGAFVDIGVHQDGLVHISELSHEFVSDPKLVVSPGDQVKVKVLAVDLEKKQISLSMKLEARPMVESFAPRNTASRNADSRNADSRNADSRNADSRNADSRQASPKNDVSRKGTSRDGASRGGASRDGMSRDATSKGSPSKNHSGPGKGSQTHPHRGGGPGPGPGSGPRGGKPFNNPFAALLSTTTTTAATKKS
jgi:protein Tex